MVSSLTEEAAIKKEAVFTQLEFSHDLLEDKVRPTPNAGNRIKNRCLFLLSSLSPLRNMRTAAAPLPSLSGSSAQHCTVGCLLGVGMGARPRWTLPCL